MCLKEFAVFTHPKHTSCMSWHLHASRCVYRPRETDCRLSSVRPLRLEPICECVFVFSGENVCGQSHVSLLFSQSHEDVAATRSNFVAKSADFPDNHGDFNCPKQAATNRATFSGFRGEPRHLTDKVMWRLGPPVRVLNEQRGAAASPPQSHSTPSPDYIWYISQYTSTRNVGRQEGLKSCGCFEKRDVWTGKFKAAACRETRDWLQTFPCSEIAGGGGVLV